MPKHLSQEQIDNYWQDGFCAPIDVMTEDAATELRLRFEYLERRYPDALNPFQRNNPHLAFSAIDEIAHHPVILDAVEDIIGPDILIWGTVLFIKEPNDPGYVSWHQDARYMGLEPHDGVTAWLALTPSNSESGCMKMLPGTHRDDLKPHTDTFGDNNILTRGQEVDVHEETKSVEVILKPGQMSLHHPRVIHSSKPNKSDDRRIGVVIQQLLPHNVLQTKGEPLAQWARGANVPAPYTEMPRPSGDMRPDNVAWRARVNAMWADILYDDAEKKRAY